MSISMQIDYDTCSKCGMCAIICPTKAIDHAKGEFPSRDPDRGQTCMACGQCMMVCPKQSIQITGITYNDLFPLPQKSPDYNALFDLMGTRRSIRNFKDEPVPRELLEKVLAAVAQAPMGFPPHKTHVTVVQSRSAIAKLLPEIVGLYEDMQRWMKNPVIRFMIKRQSSPEDFSTIVNHLIPLMAKRLPEISKGSDEITWRAPALMIFHAGRLAECHSVDACIALTYAFLAAHALGLGVTVSGLLPPAINHNPKLRDMLNIPQEHEVVCAMMLGYPRYNYHQGIKRTLAGVNWVGYPLLS